MKKRGLPGRPLTLVVSVGVVLASLGISASAAVAAPPTIDRQWVTDVTPNDATLHAEINPNGRYTAYRFQIDTTGNFRFERNDGCLLHLPGTACTLAIVPGDPLPPGLVVPPESSIPAGYDSQHVSINMASIGASLQPGTTYHYRVVATNGIGEIIEGPDQTFTTPPGTAPPTIESESVSNITPTDATLEAQINPGGLETSYEFRLETPECQMMMGPGPLVGCKLVGAGTIPAGSSTQTVSTDIAKAWQDLSPNTTYMYAVFATNSAGRASGRHEAWFTTAAASPPTIKSESVSNITPTDATLEAKINTEGLGTTYEFQLRSPVCQPPAMCIPIVTYPLPSGKLLGSFVGQSVSLDLNSAGVILEPGREYFYSVNATNAAGTTEGQFQTFTTPSATEPPVIDRTLSSADPSLSSGAKRGGPRKKTSRCKRKLRHRHRGHGRGFRKHRHRKHARRGGKRRVFQRVSGNIKARSAGRACLLGPPKKSRGR